MLNNENSNTYNVNELVLMFQENRALDYWHFSPITNNSEQPLRCLYIHNEDGTVGNAVDTIIKSQTL